MCYKIYIYSIGNKCSQSGVETRDGFEVRKKK